MKQVLHPHQRAARVIRLMGWLGLLCWVAIGVAVGMPAMATGRAVPSEMVIVALLVLPIPVSLFFVARGLFAQRDWARWAGMAYGVLALFGIPIGTIAGGYVLWQLQKGWPGGAAAVHDPLVQRIDPTL